MKSCKNIFHQSLVLEYFKQFFISFLQEAMVSELKQRNRQIKEKKLLNKDEVYHGALEDILLGKLIYLLYACVLTFSYSGVIGT